MDVDYLLKDSNKKKLGNLTLYELFAIWSKNMIDIINDILKFIDNFKNLNINEINIMGEIYNFIEIFTKKKRILYSGITILLIVILFSFSK